MSKFGDPGHADPAAAGRKSKRGPSLKTQMKRHLSGKHHMQMITEAMSEFLVEAINNGRKTGNWDDYKWFIANSGIAKFPDEVATEEVADLSNITVVFGDDGEEEQEDEPNK